MILFIIGFGSTTLFYVVSQQQLFHNWWCGLKYVPTLMAVGIGIAFNNALATLDGFFGKTGEFVRTPKFGDGAQKTGDWRKRLRGTRIKVGWKAWAELIIGLYLTACAIALMFFDNWFQQVSMALPFLLIFIAGYLYVSLQTFRTAWLAQRRQPTPA
jgi:hypothetical protein